jgi:hypothetical protein
MQKCLDLQSQGVRTPCTNLQLSLQEATSSKQASSSQYRAEVQYVQHSRIRKTALHNTQRISSQSQAQQDLGCCHNLLKVVVAMAGRLASRNQRS